MAIQIATATFTGVEDSVDVTWPAMAGDFGIAHGVTVSDAGGPVSVHITNRIATGCTVNPSARFTGVVELVIYDKP
jgi:hypothetical protein